MKYTFLILLCICYPIAAIPPIIPSINGASLYHLCAWMQSKLSQKNEAEHDAQQHSLQTPHAQRLSARARVYQKDSEIIVVTPCGYTVRHIVPLETKHGIVFFPSYEEKNEELS